MGSLEDFFKARTFRTILISDFTNRKSRRPSYSMRAYARDLGISPSTFGGIVRGRYGISEATARKISEKLKFPIEETEFFVALVNSRHARTKIERARAKLFLTKYRNVIEYRQLISDQVEILSHWYYPAILELISINKGFVRVPKFAAQLGVTAADVRKAIKCLLRSKILIHSSAKHLSRNESYLSLDSDIPNEVLRSFHKQVLERAKVSIDRQPVEKRKYLTSILSFEAGRAQEARKWLDETYQTFLDEFGADETTKRTDSVYAFGLQFFQLDSGDQ